MIDESNFFVSSASGGLFKTADSGISWSSLFDDEMSLSIGDFVISQGVDRFSNKRIIYVGTGEANAGGGSLAYDGNGIYQSRDGGRAIQY